MSQFNKCQNQKFDGVFTMFFEAFLIKFRVFLTDAIIVNIKLLPKAILNATN